MPSTLAKISPPGITDRFVTSHTNSPALAARSVGIWNKVASAKTFPGPCAATAGNRQRGARNTESHQHDGVAERERVNRRGKGLQHAHICERDGGPQQQAEEDGEQEVRDAVDDVEAAAEGEKSSRLQWRRPVWRSG